MKMRRINIQIRGTDPRKKMKILAFVAATWGKGKVRGCRGGRRSTRGDKSGTT